MANVGTCLIADVYTEPDFFFSRWFSRRFIPMIIPPVCQLESPIHFLLVSTIYFDATTLDSVNNQTGAIIGQVVVGIICDRIGRKAALVITTSLIVLGATLATAAHGAGGSAAGLFWFLTVARQIILFNQVG